MAGGNARRANKEGSQASEEVGLGVSRPIVSVFTQHDSHTFSLLSLKSIHRLLAHQLSLSHLLLLRWSPLGCARNTCSDGATEKMES